MHIQVHTNDDVEGREALVQWVERLVQDDLSMFEDWLTRVEVHIGDENSAKGGAADKRCMMEGRMRGHQPLAVTEHADSIDQAVRGAASKLARSLRQVIDKQRDPRR